MKYIYTYLLFLLFTNAFPQASLRGKISNDTTRSPVKDAVVFISELNLSTKSDSNGEFLFENLPVQKFVVQVKLLGYKTQILPVNLTETGTLNIFLSKNYFEFPELVIYGYNVSSQEKTANVISQLSTDEMRNNGAMNLSDGIAKIPGVSQLSTGAGISKPVIRGMFGNRIQTVLFGLRFDNQQWQDEHGLGLSDVGVDHVEIIKGAASLLYGSEAMGGVLNIIEEKPPAQNNVIADASTRFFSNTYGNATDAGIKGATGKMNWRIRIGEESHADYSDGNDKRILNSRFGGYYGKAGIGFRKDRWINETNYMISQSNFGFLMDPIQLQDQPDSRLSRNFDKPHHTVNLNILSTQNYFFFKESKLKLNAGFQNNNRQEQEGGNKISLNMILNSYILNALWTKQITKKTEFSLGTQDYFQTNKNIGSRTIIPDAKQYESSAFAYFKTVFKQIIIEGGLRYDLRFIETFSTGIINTDPTTPGTKICPFSRLYNATNGSIGFSWFDDKHWNVKSNISSGYRAGNLAELSSNGLHEGTIRYEIGDINLKLEQNLCGDILIGYQSALISLSASAYLNHFFNYIYLSGTDEQYIGFQIYRYVQKNASIQGLELASELHPGKIKWFNWITSYSYIAGTLDDGGYLPFIPAPKINSDIKLTFNKENKQLYIKPGVSYIFQQTTPGQFETSTSDYTLFNLSTGIYIKRIKNDYQVSLNANNILNTVYYDHLSRYKYFGIYNLGRNVCLNFKIIFK
jgi:iron complex outermembrane receptor protein